MFMNFRTLVLRDDDGSLGAPSPDEQTFANDGDFAAARAALVHSAPEILPTDEPTSPVTDDAALEAAAIDELIGTPAGEPASGGESGVTPPETTVDPYAAYGGEESVKHALALRQMHNDPDGQRQLAGQLLAQLGYKPEQIRAALNDEAQAEPDPLDALLNMEDGDVVTGAELKAIVAALASRDEAVSRQAVQPVEQQWQQQQAAQIQQMADATYVEVLGVPPQTPEGQKSFLAQANAVQARAETLVTPGETNPSRIRLAILTAASQIKAEDESRFKAYVAGKRKAAADLPTNLGGGQPPGGEPAKDPQNMKEARAAAKAAGLFN